MKHTTSIQTTLGYTPRRIAVLRALQLGDLLCAVPAFRSLRNAFPDAEIHLIGLPWAADFTHRFDAYFDGYIPFPGYPGLPEQPVDPKRIVTFIRDMQHRDFDLVLQMQGNGSFVNPFVELLGARTIAGYYRPGDYRPDSGLFMEYPDYGSEVHRHLHLMRYLGLETEGDHLEYPVSATEEDDWGDIQEDFDIFPRAYICIHPGARAENRRWDPAYFAQLGDICASSGHKVVITGTEEERTIAECITGLMNHPATNMIGKTNLGTLGCLVRDAKLVISNDTGIAHVAAAMRTPSVVISTGSDPERWAPLDETLHTTIFWDRHHNFCESIAAVRSRLETPDTMLPVAGFETV